MARHSDSGRKISLHNLPSTVTTTNGHQCCVDKCKMPEFWKPNTSEKGLLVQRCDLQDMWKTRTLGKGMSTWKRTNTETNKAPRALAKVEGKVQAKAKARQRIEHLKHACVVEGQGTRNQTANSRLLHVQIAERLVI